MSDLKHCFSMNQIELNLILINYMILIFINELVNDVKRVIYFMDYLVQVKHQLLMQLQIMIIDILLKFHYHELNKMMKSKTF